MRKLLTAVLMLPLCLCASVMDDARAGLEKARADYDSVCQSKAKGLKSLLEKIESLKAETDALDSELLSLKAESLAQDDCFQSLSFKAAKFDSLRGEAVKLQAFLKDRGVSNIPALSFDKKQFNEDLRLILTAANSEVSPETVFHKAVLGDSETAIKNYNEGKSQLLDIDPSLGRLAKSRHEGFAERFKAGGIWMYPIFAFGFAALVIGIAKAAVSFRAKRAPAGIVGVISDLLDAGKAGEAEALAAKAPYPYGPLLVSLVENRDIEKPLLEEMSYEHMLNVGEKLYSGLGFISVTAAVSPLLGLLGTVTGIIKTFGDLSLYGAGNSQLMSAGISEALITTEFGLVVAIPAIVVHALLSRRAKAVLSDMEKLAAAFLGRTSK